MSPKQELHLTSSALQDAYSDFILSRQAMQCTRATLEFYKYTAGWFLLWAEQHGVTSPDGITAHLIREYLAELAENGKKDTTCHDHARAIRTLIRFWHAEGYIPEVVKFDMPMLSQKRLPNLTIEQLEIILKACNIRDRAIITFMVDSGLRRSEVIHLNWGDVDMASGLIRIKQGKGKKDRSAVIGSKARRTLLKYRRTLENVTDDDPLFQTQDKTRFTTDGFGLIFKRITARTGIYVSAHCLRRTFAILSKRAGMGDLYLMHLGGWSSLEMVQHYTQMIDDDLLDAHRKFSPVDNLK